MKAPTVSIAEGKKGFSRFQHSGGFDEAKR
jgi:hypothetical protein